MDNPTLDEAAAAMHEMYEAYIRAGFTEAQALELVKAAIHNAAAEDPRRFL